ncbi:MAG: TonB-dependent receptor [Planctomycetota bacterium]
MALNRYLVSWFAVLGIVLAAETNGQTLADLIRDETGVETSATGPIHFNLTDSDHAEREKDAFLQTTSPIRQASMLQPTPLLLSKPNVAPEITPRVSTTVDPDVAVSLTARLFGSGVERSQLRSAKAAVASLSVDLVRGAEAAPLITTDLGDLLKKSPTALSVKTQTRSPIVNDSRVRDSRVGTLAASGSHWVPARADLDTALNKIDSRLVKDVVVVPGPYSSVYGPGFNFIDFELLPSPRYENRETHGTTSFNHKSNGSQWLGQQTLLMGDEDWGFRGSYTYREGTDYRDGNGNEVASDYTSQMFSLAAGRDFSSGRTVEVSLLRLDQVDVEFPGFVFDINLLVTDGYDVTYIDSESPIGDQVETEIWYNRTEFQGDSVNPAKTQQFPFLAFVAFDGTTDADLISTGYRSAISWGDASDPMRIVAGSDLRFIKQEINEDFTTLDLNTATLISGQSPLPRSFSVNPGFFLDYTEELNCEYTFQSGLRLDYVQTDVVEDLVTLGQVGLTQLPYSSVVGTDLTQSDRFLWGMYGRLQRQISESLKSSVSLGYAERAPTLTELYGVEQLLLLVQNGLNTVTGDPRLEDEKLIQVDFTFDYEAERLRAGIRGYHGWAFDYVTFENTTDPSAALFQGEVTQVNLRAVNTRLATLTGLEGYVELAPEQRLSPYATLQMQDGRDRTRNGDFATRPANTFFPSDQIAGLPRGAFSGVAGSDSEPLPGITPVQARLGFRVRESAKDPQWMVDIGARVVDNQDRVATSLREFPTPGFTVWDLRCIWQPRRYESVTLYTGIENFTDKAYREHLDFRSRLGVDVFQPGIAFYVAGDLAF